MEIGDLPDELFPEIFKYFLYRDMLNIATVSRLFSRQVLLTRTRRALTLVPPQLILPHLPPVLLSLTPI